MFNQTFDSAVVRHVAVVGSGLAGEEQPGHLWCVDHNIGMAGDWLNGGPAEGAFNSACGLVAELTVFPATR